MPAPIAKGLIILSSLLIAAGAAVYQDPVVQRWIDAQRRRIAMALHSLGDEIDLARNAALNDPPASAPSEEDEEQRRRRRIEELVRRNRNELIRKAREEGVAVDLDELAAIGTESEADAVARLKKTRESMDRSDKSRSFDTLVSSDGTLRAETTASEAQRGPPEGLRHRNAGARGLASGSLWANPFVDEAVFFDHDREAAQGSSTGKAAERIELPFLPEGSMSHEDYELQLKLLEEANRSKASNKPVEQSDAQPAFDELYDAVPTNRAHYTQELAALEEVQKQILLRAQDRHAKGEGEASVTLADLEGLPHTDALDELRRDLIAAQTKNAPTQESRESTATLAAPFSEQLIDMSDSRNSQPEMSSNPSAPSVTASYHSATASRRSSSPSVQSFMPDAEDSDIPTPTGTMTPVEVELDDGFNTAASHVGTNASDVGDIDLLSDFGVESVRSGALTPSSFGGSEWTDMDSDVGMSEDEHHPHVPQQYQVPEPQQQSQ